AEAGPGVGEVAGGAMMRDGIAEADARTRCWFVDSKGLVVRSRSDLADHKRPFAHDHAPLPDLLSASGGLAPRALMGAPGQPATFTRDVIETMSEINERPLIFALS